MTSPLPDDDFAARVIPHLRELAHFDQDRRDAGEELIDYPAPHDDPYKAGIPENWSTVAFLTWIRMELEQGRSIEFRLVEDVRPAYLSVRRLPSELWPRT